MKNAATGALRCALAMGLLCAAIPLFAKPKCEADTFTGKKGCVYGIGTIGMAGVGNQIVTADGQMGFQRSVMFVYKPLDVSSILFRIDGRRTLRLSAKTPPDRRCIVPVNSAPGLGPCWPRSLVLSSRS